MDELFRYSFVELIKSNKDESIFISVPLTAFEFGKKKLSVSPLKSKIQLDIIILNYFGVTQFIDINKGLKPKVERFFKGIAINIRQNRENLNKFLPILEFVSRKFPDGWRMLSKIYYELHNIPKAIESLQNYVSDHRVEVKEKIVTWELLAKLYSLYNDYTGEAQSLVEMCNIEEISINDLNNAVNSLMILFKEKKTNFKKKETFILLNSVAEKMSKNIGSVEFTTADLTELAWVYLHLGKREKAKSFVKMALNRDSRHPHALNLAKKLNININNYFSPT